MLKLVRQPCTALALLVIVGCTHLDAPDTPGEPLFTNIDAARSAWLANHPNAYSFEVAAASSWIRASGFYRVTVVADRVVSATDADGKQDTRFATTVDAIWAGILANRAGSLNTAIFNARGVPVEADYGDWALDGGVHYWVRNFKE